MRKQLNVQQETYNKVVNECIKEFLRDNPKFKNIKITHDFIIDRIARYYLGEWL